MTGLSSALHDDGGPQQLTPRTTNGSVDSGLNSGRRSQTPPLLSLDQIKLTCSSNDYADGPTGAQQKPNVVRTNGQQETLEERRQNLHNLHCLSQHGNTGSSLSSREDMLQSSSVEGSQSSIRTCKGSINSGPRLLGTPANGDQIVRTQPKRSELNSEELKPLSDEIREVEVTPGSMTNIIRDKHADKCSECERCRCSECSRLRTLPSCWLCGRRCVCSAQSAVEYCTCACCVKGLFYHCSSDDEDMCADHPFSCSQSHCCVRWTTISLLSLFLPCLLCYLPAKGCVALCQCCYDRATRPGCRCKNSTAPHHKNSKPT